jgi:multidrug efflux system membrane fusion protein
MMQRGKPSPGRGWLLVAAALIVAAAGGWLTLTGSRAQEPRHPQAQPAGVPVTTIAAKRESVPIYARGLGTVQAWRSVVVRAQVTGYLQSIDFREGQEVKPGQQLAVIDPRPYAAALAQAQAKKAGDAANLANDAVNLRRDSALAQKEFASRQQVDNDMALVRQFQANVAADEAAIATAQLNLSFCTITAPIEGVVGFRQVDIGNLVLANSTQGILTIQQIHPIAVVFTLAQQQLPAVQAALAAGKPPVIVYTPGGEKKLSSGELLTPNNTIDVTTGTISLKALFQNADNALWPGQFVDARLQVRLQPDAVVVPLRTLQHGPDGLYVYVVKPDATAAQQAVTVSYQDDRMAVVATGLKGGEQIVLSGQSRLQDGTKVSTKPAAPTES